MKALFFTACCAAALACSSGPAEFPAPDFKLKSPMTGREVSLLDIKGRPAVIYWFASW